MRILFLALLLCVVSFSAARPLPRVQTRSTTEWDRALLRSGRSEGRVTFELRSSSHIGNDLEADDKVVLDLEIQPTNDLAVSRVFLNNTRLAVRWENGRTESSQRLHLIPDTDVRLSWSGTVADDLQILDFIFQGSFGQLNFTAIMSSTASPPSVGISLDISLDRNIASLLESPLPPYHDDSTSSIHDHEGDGMSDGSSEEEFNLVDEIEALHLLQNQAKQLDAQITAKQRAVAYRLKNDQDQLCLKHLLKECDGVMCAARAVWQRVCDKVGIKTDPLLGLTRLPNLRQQNVIPSHYHEKSAHNCTNGTHHAAQAMMLPITITKGGGDGVDTFSGFKLPETSSPLFRVFSIVAAVLGITAVLAFIKRKCTSARTRVERAADREERRNARAYRRAARRALMRKRWETFVHALNCFKAEEKPPIGDYEEKRALILEQAFLEQDLDQAEKGEVMEAEIRELRYAHEIVSSLVQVGEHRFEMVTPVYQPPPPPPATTSDARSRANSAYTLPSYTSESLPDYTSRPDDRSSTNSVVDGFTPSTSENRDFQSPLSPMSESSRTSRYTPTSSVLEMSPRPSEETLRRVSGETAFR